MGMERLRRKLGEFSQKVGDFAEDEHSGGKPPSAIKMMAAARAAFLASSVLAGSAQENTAHAARLSRAQIEELQQKALTEEDVGYLALNVYHEGRGESVPGQLAIAQVTLRRLATGRYGKTLEDVVFAQRQFSWTNDPRILLTEIDEDVYADIYARLSLLAGAHGSSLQEIVQRLAETTGISASAEFYKRTDWDENDPEETRMSDDTKEMFRKLKKAGTIGAHTFYALPSTKPKQKEARN